MSKVPDLGFRHHRGDEMNRAVGLLLAVGLLAAACSAHGASPGPSPSARTTAGAVPATTAPAAEALEPQPIKGCVPVCNPPGLTRPGPIPERPYKTQWFFGSQMVITPSEPWSIHEDSTGEFSLTLDAKPVNSVLFWEDVYPIGRSGQRVRGVPLTVKGLLGWLRKTPRLHVSAARPGTTGRDLPATVVDVTVAKGTKNEDPGCPSHACVLWLSYPQWDLAWGIAEPQVQRFYLSDVSYGGQKHLFVAVVYPDKPQEMKSFLPHAKRLIAAAQVPAA
jgi:hypothetical protein